MSCVDNTCGIGGWPGPLPGDPDNLVSLRASTAYGGIDVVWTYPTTNPFAVAHVRLLRGLSNDFTEAAERAIVAGNSYYDKIEVNQDTEYYYWIQIVSVNGTVFDPIGPASAYARPKSQQTLEELTGLIDAGVLAQTLKTRIDGLTLTNQALYDEIDQRLLADQGFADALSRVQSGLDQAMTYVNQEVTQRQDGDNALVHAIDLVAAANQDNMAAILEERNVRVTADSALSQKIDDIISQTGGNTAAIDQKLTTLTTRYEATASDVTRLATTVGDSNSGLLHDQQVTSTALASLASDFTTVEAAVNGDVATGQVGLIAKVDSVTGEMQSMWFAKVQNNDLIGGFGILNNGRIVEAGFDVDRFWVGRTGPDKVKPFIIDNGIVYIDKARIRDADIDSLKIAGEAITVPIVSTYPDKKRRGRGEGNADVVNELYMNMVQPGLAYILMTSAMGFDKNDRFWQFVVRVDGVDMRNIMGRQAESAPVLSCVLPLQTGVHHVEILWSAHSDVIMGYNDLFMMGVKR